MPWNANSVLSCINIHEDKLLSILWLVMLKIQKIHFLPIEHHKVDEGHLTGGATTEQERRQRQTV